jgi:type IV pilus assembly protein PilQ
MLKHKEDAQKLTEAMNDSAQLTTRLWQIHYAKADDIARFLQDNAVSLLSKRGHVRVDARTNMLCIQELASHVRELERVIRQLDIPVKQVRIKARLASVDSDYERELGLNFSVKNPTPDGNPRTLADTVTTRFSLAVATLADGSLLDVALAAMENQGRGDLISSPSLFTSNQQTAVIESGEEIPYQEISLSGGTGVAFKKAVLSLKVTPQIMPGNRVLLQLSVNQDRPSSRIVLGVPAIATRQITTNVLVKNGQTLVLGGIYELNKESDVQRIPFLGKIPVIGLIFQQQNLKTNKRELLIFVTPTIIA